MRIVVLRQKGVRVFAAVVVRSAFCAAAALPPWFCILLAPPGLSPSTRFVYAAFRLVQDVYP
jgi:hypothetical protein